MRIRQYICGLLLAVASGIAPAAEFPDKPITLTVGFAPGGISDVIARSFGKRLEKELGGSVVVVNKPGAQGTLGQNQVRRSKPDGYSLVFVTTSSSAISPYLANDVYKPTDFDYLGGFGVYRLGLAVRTDSPYTTLQSLLDAARSSPKFYGSSSAVTNIGVNELATKAGAKLEVVNYKSGPEIITALLGDQISMIVQAPSEMQPHIQAGKLRLLGIATGKRWASNPAVPTFKEAGYDVAVEAWIGVAGPKGMPRDVLNKLETAFGRIAADPAFAAELDTLGVDMQQLNGVDFGNRMQATFIAAEPVMRAQVAANK